MISEFCKVVNVKKGCVSRGKISKEWPNLLLQSLVQLRVSHSLDSSHPTPPDISEQYQVRANGTATDIFRSLNLND